MNRISDSSGAGSAGNRVIEAAGNSLNSCSQGHPVTIELGWISEFTWWRLQREGQVVQSLFQSSLESQTSPTRLELNVACSTSESEISPEEGRRKNPGNVITGKHQGRTGKEKGPRIEDDVTIFVKHNWPQSPAFQACNCNVLPNLSYPQIDSLLCLLTFY